MTYNHEQFIIDCMKGIDIQCVNFNIKVVIGDDFSTDNNLELIKKFIASSKNKNINYVILDRKKGDDYYLERQKKGRIYNHLNIINNCSGKYIALLDGDDYWTDPYKLQKQVDFLEDNSDFSICFHNVSIDNGNHDLKPFYSDKWGEGDINGRKPPMQVTGILDVAESNYLHTLSIVFRRYELTHNELALIERSQAGDWPLTMLNARNGKIRYMPDVMGVYRVHEGGVWSSGDAVNRLIRTAMTAREMLLFSDFNSEIKDVLKTTLGKTFVRIISCNPNEKQKNEIVEIITPFCESKYGFDAIIKGITEGILEGQQKVQENVAETFLSSKTYRLGHAIVHPLKALHRVYNSLRKAHG